MYGKKTVRNGDKGKGEEARGKGRDSHRVTMGCARRSCITK